MPANADDSVILIERIRSADDRDAWAAFVRLYEPLITGWLRKAGVSQQLAEDIRQEVFLKVLTEIGTFQHNGRAGAFRAWLRMIIRNRLKTVIRSEAATDHYPAEIAEQLEDESSTLSQSWDVEHDRHLIERLLDRISMGFEKSTIETFRRVVLLEENAEDIATELGMTLNALRVSQSRVLAAMRKAATHLMD